MYRYSIDLLDKCIIFVRRMKLLGIIISHIGLRCGVIRE